VSLSKTTESSRSFTLLEKYPVFENLPAYFELEYPKFVAFIKKYYEFLSDYNPTQLIEDKQFMRDFVEIEEDLLRVMSKELLLGRDYYDTFIDKRTAVQMSNPIYRAKGTHYSIQQFFRVFFGFDVDIRYGRNEVFLVGDPNRELLELTAKINDRGVRYPTDKIRFNFDDGTIAVYVTADKPMENIRDGLYVTNDYNEVTEKYNPYVIDPDDYVLPYWVEIIDIVFHQLREDVDYIIRYAEKTIQFIQNDNPIYDDPWLNELAETGVMPLGQTVRVDIHREFPAGSSIGDEMDEKMITNNGFYQMFALAIRSPRSIKSWREAYKDFVHPAGMYLEGDVLLESSDKLFGKQPDVDMEQYRLPVHETAELMAFISTHITELDIDKYTQAYQTYAHQGFTENDRNPYDEYLYDSGTERWAEERLDSDRPDRVFRTRVNDLKNEVWTLEEIAGQYIDMERFDDIEPRRFDEVVTDMSQIINTLDENVFIAKPNQVLFCLDSDRRDQYVMGGTLDFPPEYAGCPGFIFGIPKYFKIWPQYVTPKYMDSYPLDGGQNDELVENDVRSEPGAVAGVARASKSAYRDERIWSYTLMPDPTKRGDFNYTRNIDSFGNYLGGPEDWIDELDYMNPFGQSTVAAAVVVMQNYIRRTYRDGVTPIQREYHDIDYIDTPERVDSA
jgi:hypothetical protein